MPLHPAQRTSLYDIRNVTAADVAGCCAACEADAACRYFEFVIPKRRCWLKTSGAGPKLKDATCTSGGVTPPTPPPPQPPPPPLPPLPPQGPCTDDLGCSLCGRCDRGKCVCDPGFTGEQCELLALGPPPPCGDGGLCMHGELVGSNSGATPTTGWGTWGGTVVANANFTEFHMYASMMQGNGALMGTGQGASWITNSAVVHAVASRPGGPYTATDIALGPRGKITRATTPAGCSDPAAAHPGSGSARVPAVVCPVTEANQFWDAVTVYDTQTASI